MKRLALFLDGTWNDPEDKTNVFRLSKAVAGPEHGVAEQDSLYLTGVGVKLTERLRGAFGHGLSDNVLEAYTWLAERYEDGDEIYLFGFSRGAYTARSVAGLIILCGLIRQGGKLSSAQVYKRYQAGKSKLPLHQIEYLLTHPGDPGSARLTEEDRTLAGNSRRVPIRFIGVWDTVGALGIPWTAAPLVGRGNFFFHNTNLSVLVRAAFHALAIDEQRAPYKPTLWNTYTATGLAPKPTLERKNFEQRWFIGAHANVGGGYGDEDLLADIPLAWLQSKAAEHGLKFHESLIQRAGATDCKPRDSFAEFMKGIYRVVRLGIRFNRVMGRGAHAVRGGIAVPVNEAVDASVFRRYQTHPGYRPPILETCLKERNVDPLKQTDDLYL